MTDTDENKNAALDLTTKNLAVFPVHASGEKVKCPAVTGSWKSHSTSDPCEAALLWEQSPNAAPAIDCGKSGLVVIDVDVRPGKDGREGWEKLAAQHGGLADTPLVSTPSGGNHVYFRQRGGMEPPGCGTGSLPPSIDAKGAGGYVVGCGAVTAAGRYELIGGSLDRIAELPEWLYDMLRPADEVRQMQVRAELDAPREIEAAAAWLASDAPPAIQGLGGDNQTFKIAAELVRDRALTPETALDLMLEHYNPRCEPPWLPADLHKKVHSAVGSARGDIGSKTAEGMFGGVVAVPRPASITPVPKKSRGLQVQRLSEIETEAVDWLWPNHFARGMLNLIAGEPKIGKSQLLMHVSSVITRGGTWPSGETCSKGGVLCVQAEDAVKQTVRPRFIAAGGDPELFAVLNTTKPEDGDERALRLSHDLGDVESWLEANPEFRTVIFDPLTAYLGNADSHKDAEVRAVLTPLAAMAERLGVTVIAVHHLNKGGHGGGASGRLAGSAAFLQVARTVHMVVRDPDEPVNRRIFQVHRANLGKPTPGRSFHLEETTVPARGGITAEISRLVWGQEKTVDLDEALDTTRPKRESQVDKAMTWLRDRLAAGPVESGELELDAKGNGISRAALRRAKDELKVVTMKDRGKAFGAWYWSLPSADKLFGPVTLPEEKRLQ